VKFIQDFIKQALKDVSYDQEAKDKFHRLGKKVLKAIAEGMGLQSGSYNIRSNLGGPAVSGEVTLHGEHIYIQFGQFSNGCNGFMYRSCMNQKDYTGGFNHWMPFEYLIDLPKACKLFQDTAEAWERYVDPRKLKTITK